MSPRPTPTPLARTREPDRSDPAADGIGHRLTGGPPPPAGSPGPAPIPGPSARQPEPGAGAFPPSRGVMGPYRARVPFEMGEKAPKDGELRQIQISRSQHSSGDALLAFALRAPVPPAFGPGPSPRVSPPIPGGESRAISRLNDVSPGSPNVLRAIPRPMTGVPGIAGGRRRRHFYQGRRRLCRHNRCGRWGRS